MDENEKVNEKVNDTGKESNGLAIAALILAILALLVSFIPIINMLGIVVAIGAGILGIVALVKKQKKGMVIAALVIAVIALVTTYVSQKLLLKGIDKFIAGSGESIVQKIEDTADKYKEEVEEKSNEIINSEDNVDKTTDTSSTDETEDEEVYDWTQDFDIEFKEFSVEEINEYSSKTKLEAIVTNKTSENQSLNFKVDAYDSDGIRIKHDTGAVYNLTPGRKEKVELFTIMSAKDIEQMKTATFEVVEVKVW